MFCPPGYTPASDLWDRFLKKRKHDITSAAIRHYHSSDFQPKIVRGSPLDICEHVFLKLLSACGPYLAAPDGRTMKLAAPQLNDVSILFVVAEYRYSATFLFQGSQTKDSSESVRKIAGPNFKVFDGPLNGLAWWRDRYPIKAIGKLKSIGGVQPIDTFHCLPLFFERERFQIVEQLPAWASGNDLLNDNDVIVRKFSGWSICLSKNGVRAFMDGLETKFLISENVVSKPVDRSKGRPPKVAAALADFQSVFPLGRKGTLKSMLHEIETATGRIYSESTLKRVLKKVNSE